MFFDKYQVTSYDNVDTVELSYVMERIEVALKDKIAYEPPYHHVFVIPKEEAEELLLALRVALKGL